MLTSIQYLGSGKIMYLWLYMAQNVLQTIIIGMVRQARLGNMFTEVVSLIKPPLIMNEISLSECSKLASATYYQNINQL